MSFASLLETFAGPRKEAAFLAESNQRQAINTRNDLLNLRLAEQKASWEQMVNAFNADARIQTLTSLISPKDNPDLFEALKAVWESWKVERQKSRFDSHWQPVDFKPTIVNTFNLSTYDLPSIDADYRQPYHAPIKAIIDQKASAGATITMMARWLFWDNNRDAQSFRLSDEEARKLRVLKSTKGVDDFNRYFELHVGFNKKDMRLRLFPKEGKLVRRDFHSQEELFRYIAPKLVDSQGKIGTVPILGLTRLKG